jgi:rhomboid protease GluP
MALTYAVVFLIFGFLMPNVDNLAHIGGFVGGFLAAYVLNPVKQETFGNLLMALVCIAATALSILASIILA